MLIDHGTWDESNGCCSSHGKLRRHAIARRNGIASGGIPPVELVGAPPQWHSGDGLSNIDSRSGDGSGECGGGGGSDVDGINSGASSKGWGEGRVDGGGGDGSSGGGDGDPLVRKMFAFLCAGSKDEAATHLPPAPDVGGAGAGWSVDWWGAMGGDSVAAAELVAEWEWAEWQRSGRGQPRGVEGGHGVSDSSQPSVVGKLRVADLYALSPWELRHKATGGEGASNAQRADARADAGTEAEAEAGTEAGGGVEIEARGSAEGEGGADAVGRKKGGVAAAAVQSELFWEAEAAAHGHSCTGFPSDACAHPSPSCADLPSPFTSSAACPPTPPSATPFLSSLLAASDLGEGGESGEDDGNDRSDGASCTGGGRGGGSDEGGGGGCERPSLLLTGGTGFLGPHLLTARKTSAVHTHAAYTCSP